MPHNNRVVVTGLGVVAPNGIGKEAFWSSLLECRSGIKTITLFDASKHSCRIAGEVSDFDPAVHIRPGINTKRLARQTQMALAATAQAFLDANLSCDTLISEKAIPLVLGVSSSAIEVIEHGMERMAGRGPEKVPSHIVHACQPHQAASIIALNFPLISRSTTIASACAAGLDAIGAAADLIRAGRADVVVCGGTDAPINPLTFACLAKAGLVSLRNETPGKASRPFDADHDSGVISEGAGILILENLTHALARNAKPYLEITGYATRFDTDPAVSGSGLNATMNEALANAGRRPLNVDFICAHGPGHPVLDRMETKMIKNVFGTHAHKVPVSSIKGVTGNPLSAAGPFQLIACSLATRHGIIPPTANLEKPDLECDLDYVPLHARHAHLNCILINAHGLGGGNSCLITERVS
ncbi:MAG: beta-ketoacyl-[acyl-carrier-protein] synthase family protein [bacterium]